MMTDSFTSDEKALLGQMATLGWLIRLRAWSRKAPLGAYSAGSNAERKVVPLMCQLTDRPLLELVEDFFGGPQLFQQASRYVAADFIRKSFHDLRLRFSDSAKEDLCADFYRLIRWCAKKNQSFNRGTTRFHSSFLQQGWDFHLVGKECSLAYQTFHPHSSGITKVICHHVGGSLGPLGYVLTSQETTTLGAFLKTGSSVPPLTDTHSPKVHICPQSLELCSAVMALRPWQKESTRSCARFMRRLEKRLGLNPGSRYNLYLDLYEDFAFWHEYGHLHFGALEKGFCRPAIEAVFINRYYGFWIEMLCDAFAFERVLAKADALRRLTTMALILDGREPETLTPPNLIAARSLMEHNPSLYLFDISFEMLRKLQASGKELKRRALQVNISPRDLYWAGWIIDQENELLKEFFEWQKKTLERALKELVEMIAEN